LKRALSVFALLGLTCVASPARAIDLPPLDGAPVKLDITETSVVAQRFNARSGELYEDQGYFAWLNRLNMVLGWKKWTLGTRLDSSVYALRPVDRNNDPNRNVALFADGASRYRNEIYPAKLWLTYKTDGIEVTGGDSYVQFGRGLTLSLRKVDELGLDTTLFGGKVTMQKDPFGVTLIAGLANPARVDEPTGRALFPTTPVPALNGNQRVPPLPLFGSDRIIGAEVTAGRGSPVILATRVVRLTKCAPYRYDANGHIVDDAFDKPVGTCDENDRLTWLNTLSSSTSPVVVSRETTNVGQSIEIPSLGGHGNFYVEGAYQVREKVRTRDKDTDGNALYASLVLTGGPIANTVEAKSYRNYFPLAGSVNVTRAAAFSNIAYSAPPTAEPVIADSMFGNFNVCVNGARDRFDYRLTPSLLAYGALEYAVSKSEIFGGTCDRWGHSTGQSAATTTDFVTDGTLGVEARFDDDKSVLFANVNARHDIIEDNTPEYRELAGQYSFTKYIKGPYSLELSGRHRYRVQDKENIRASGTSKGEPWWEGEHYTALKVAPKWVFTQGIEYTRLVGFPSWYVNGGVLYKFTSQSNIRLYVGQNRGGLRCVSGICRVFPAFSGARAELTLRF
jgi:hypothetical protein